MNQYNQRVLSVKNQISMNLDDLNQSQTTSLLEQQKKLDEGELMKIRNLFNVPISDEVVQNIGFYRPPEDSPEMKYLREREKAMGGPLPARHVKPIQITAPPLEIFKDNGGSIRNLQCHRGIEDIGRCEPEMKKPGGRPDVFRDRRGKCDDVVLYLGLDFIDALDGEPCP